VTIFTLWFENFPNNLPALLISAGVALLFVVIFVKAAISADGRSRWVRRITGPNGKWFFGLLFVGWAVVFGVGLQLVPHQGSSSPYGGLGLIALFSGVVISLGFLWTVIGEKPRPQLPCAQRVQARLRASQASSDGHCRAHSSDAICV
jgi:hypothetical protein